MSVQEVQVFKIIQLYSFILELGEHMFNDGFRNITEIDYSQTVAKIMNERYQEIGLPIKCT